MTPLKGAGYIALTFLILGSAYVLIEKGQRDAEEAQREADSRVTEDVEKAVRDVIEERSALDASDRDCDAVRILREAARVSGSDGTIPFPDDIQCDDLHHDRRIDE